MNDINSRRALVKLASYGTATIGEVAPDARVLEHGLHSICPGTVMVGRAVTVRCQAGDNLALHHAIATLTTGDVLVVDYADSVETGPFGEVMALASQVRGAAGMVTNGAVRDTAQIRNLGFPVFARGVAIKGTRKLDQGAMNVPIVLAGTEILPGEIILGDDDAIIVLAAERLEAVMEVACERQAKEDIMMQRIRAGETTLSIMQLNGS